MENKNRSIILGISIIVIVIIIGVVIFFVKEQKTEIDVNNTESNIVGGDENIESEPKDSSENIPSNTISTPTENNGDNTTDFVMTR